MTRRYHSMRDAYNSIYRKPAQVQISTLREALDILDEEDALHFIGLLEAKGLSIDDQMKISREHNRKSPEEKKKANQAAMGNTPKVAPKKDERTDSQKMADATDDRPGSFYRNFK